MLSLMLPVTDIAESFPDLTPIPQEDGRLPPVCAIQYPTAFTICYDYMRAVWKEGEKSERSLKLSATCLKFNPANYTVWHYRRQCLAVVAANSDNNLEEKAALEQELTLAANLGGANPKNYQIWHHRRALLGSYYPNLLQAYLESELLYIAQVLEADSKNYHAWSHRQWLLQSVNDHSVWESELDFADKLIQHDIRNNSAWNQRWFVVHRAARKPLSKELAQREANYAIQTGAMLDPYNESPWRYLIGILKEQSNDLGLHQTLLQETENVQGVLASHGREPETCSNWTSARIDMLEMVGDAESIKKAMALALGLAEQHDLVRKKYWLHRIDQMKRKVNVS